MWRPATRQITGTNDGEFACLCLGNYRFSNLALVPLGTRRRFGPAPAEETAPPQLAQPSPSAYPRPLQNDHDSPSKRGREESPGSGDPKGKPDSVELNSHFVSPPSGHMSNSSFARLITALICISMRGLQIYYY
jgi:hypothetical protein